MVIKNIFMDKLYPFTDYRTVLRFTEAEGVADNPRLRCIKIPVPGGLAEKPVSVIPFPSQSPTTGISPDFSNWNVLLTCLVLVVSLWF